MYTITIIWTESTLWIYTNNCMCANEWQANITLALEVSHVLLTLSWRCLNGSECARWGTPPCTTHATGVGTWNASAPRLRRRAQMTRISYEYGQLGASPENAVQNRNKTQIRMMHNLIRTEQHSTHLHLIKLTFNEHILYTKMISESQGLHWYNLYLIICTYLNNYV